MSLHNLGVRVEINEGRRTKKRGLLKVTGSPTDRQTSKDCDLRRRKMDSLTVVT